MNIVLHNTFVIKDGLSYKQGCKALFLAQSTKAANILNFSLSSGPTYNQYALTARVKELSVAFLENPDDYVIVVPDEETNGTK